MDFVAIDFETANHHPSSACQLAAVVVQQSQVVREHRWLIRPPSGYFSPINISIHGIRPSDVLGSPTMAEVWPELLEILSGGLRVLLAHNARFDVGVLLASLAAHDVACPDFQFNCTRALARAAWPGRNRYGLKPLGHWLGIQFRHHDALEDARCCAKIALAIEREFGTTGPLEELEERLRVQRGYHRKGRLFSPRSIGQKPRGSLNESATDRRGFPIPTASRMAGAICPDTIRNSCVDQPLAGKNIVLLGPLRGLSVQQTTQLVTDLGAHVQSQVDPQTHIVVACGMSISQAKLQVAQSHAQESARSPSNDRTGNHLSLDKIRILSVRQFCAMIPGGAVGLS